MLHLSGVVALGYESYSIAGYIGGNNIWRIARKRKKIAIGGYKFGGYVRSPRFLQESTRLVQYCSADLILAV